MDDWDLLQRWVSHRSEEAFAELVQRHVDLVFASAQRRTGSAHLAEDVTQQTFAALARKAATIRRRAPLSAWLYSTARYAAIDALRREAVRRRHENAAAQEHRESAPPPEDACDADWPVVREHLDAAMDQLPHRDREVVLLRFFEQRSLAAVAQVQGTHTSTAHRRIERALQRLRDLLAARGVVLPTAALGSMLTARAVDAAPAGLGQAIATASLAGGIATTGFSIKAIVSVLVLAGALLGTVAAFPHLGGGRSASPPPRSATTEASAPSVASAPPMPGLMLTRGEHVVIEHEPAEAPLARRLADALDAHYVQDRGSTTDLYEKALVARQPQLLATVAHQLGRTEPPDLVQEMVEGAGGQRIATVVACVEAAQEPARILLLENEAIKEHLRSGVTLSGFSYDPETDEATFHQDFDWTSSAQPERVRDYLLPVAPSAIRHARDGELARNALEPVEALGRRMFLPLMLHLEAGALRLSLAAHLRADREIHCRWLVEAAASRVMLAAIGEAHGPAAAQALQQWDIFTHPADQTPPTAAELEEWQFTDTATEAARWSAGDRAMHAAAVAQLERVLSDGRFETLHDLLMALPVGKVTCEDVKARVRAAPR